MVFRSIKDLSEDIQHLLPQLPRDIDIVYGIPRSGMIAASIISTCLGAKLAAIGDKAHIGARGENIVLPTGSAALIVDDSINKGRALNKALKNSPSNIKNIYTCAIYARSHNVNLVDFYASVIDEPRIFQWNFLGTKDSRDFCWDMDGVICTNPIVFDDDSADYQENISKIVRPLYLPQIPAKAIITNRIERWRPETENWLNRFGVKFSNLEMQPFQNALQRRRLSSPVEFKARNYLKFEGKLFVESSERQAIEISRLTSMPVLSVETMTLHNIKG